jgi:hypothetical protein
LPSGGVAGVAVRAADWGLVVGLRADLRGLAAAAIRENFEVWWAADAQVGAWHQLNFVGAAHAALDGR